MPAPSLWCSGVINQNRSGAERTAMDFTSIFNGEALTLEQFTERTKAMKLADLSGGEYVAKGKYEADTRKLREELAGARDAITTLEAGKGDAAALQAELDKYKQAEEQRKKDAEAAEARAKLVERFNAAKGDKEFSSEYAESGVLDAFSKAVADPANTGKGDAELFAALTKDKEGVFKSANPRVNMGSIKHNEAEGAPTSLAGALRERFEQKG